MPPEVKKMKRGKQDKKPIVKPIVVSHKKMGEIKKAISSLKNNPKAQGMWGVSLKITEVPPENIFSVNSVMYSWCLERDFPMPKNEKDEQIIERLFDYRLYVFKNTFSDFMSDIFDIMTSDRASVFYIGVISGTIAGLSTYFYFFK